MRKLILSLALVLTASLSISCSKQNSILIGTWDLVKIDALGNGYMFITAGPDIRNGETGHTEHVTYDKDVLIIYTAFYNEDGTLLLEESLWCSYELDGNIMTLYYTDSYTGALVTVSQEVTFLSDVEMTIRVIRSYHEDLGESPVSSSVFYYKKRH